MSAIPLHTFPFRQERPLPFYIARLEELPPAARATYPNRHTFYEVFWITAGSGLHSIDFQGHTIAPHTLFFIAPGQIHFWQIVEPVMGYAMLFPPEFFSLGSSSRDLLVDLTLFRVGASPPALTLNGESISVADRLVVAMLAEYQASQFGQLAALQSLMTLLLLHAQRLFVAGVQQQPNAATRLTQQYVRLIEEHYAEEHSVAAYAMRLGVTAGHLTDTIRLTMGVAAGVLLRRRVALEAKRLLAHSEHTVTEIARQLNFEDPSYFGRFFRRETGRSPQAFRAAFRELYQKPRS